MYAITAPYTPGATPTTRYQVETLDTARRIANEISFGRPDLMYQDVRIERADDGQLVEYAGPAR